MRFSCNIQQLGERNEEKEMRSEKKDMTGCRIGRLFVLKDSGKRYPKTREVLWLCKCDCGNLCEVRGGHLRSGYTQSCGCLQKENREKYNILRHKYKTMSLTKSGALKGADNI